MMRRIRTIIWVIVITALFTCTEEEPTSHSDDSDTIPEPSGWELIWHDEFDGDEIDFLKWTVVERENSFNNELQYYVSEDVYLKDGCLRLRSLKRAYGSKYYTSGLVYTKHKFFCQYGRFEINAKLPYGKGLWPAHWMLPEDETWPPEIDIMEYLGHQRNTIYMTNHWLENGKHKGNGGSYTGPYDYSADFHSFALEWEADSLRWYIDGVLRHASTEGIPHKPFFIILNTAVGGEWPGDPDETTSWPQYHDIDYVRVYKRGITALTESQFGHHL